MTTLPRRSASFHGLPSRVDRVEVGGVHPDLEVFGLEQGTPARADQGEPANSF
jgi:hypothetical protein